MKRMIVVDGTFLKAKFKGSLLGSSTQDGDFHLYPLAFEILDSENDDFWIWFLRGLKIVIPNGEDLVFVSDCSLSVAKTLSTIYPLTHHGICRVHLLKNIKSQFGKKCLISSIQVVVDAYTQFEFHDIFQAAALATTMKNSY
ncbi:hypothetical protein V5N11_034593 [Cardamine amara subsp. amara]|uniref:MULE transposase domain-containing protein n=1 Tax=Cardamine amara subsp. amara TaxID=228776 RepID=A0ABD1AMB4_CARAN